MIDTEEKVESLEVESLEEIVDQCIRALEICLEAGNDMRSGHLAVVWSTLQRAKRARYG